MIIKKRILCISLSAMFSSITASAAYDNPVGNTLTQYTNTNVGVLTNEGTIQSGYYYVDLALTNSGVFGNGLSTNYAWPVDLGGTANIINNTSSGTITGYFNAVYLETNVSASIQNAGVITTTWPINASHSNIGTVYADGAGIFVNSGSSLSNLTNTGLITGTTVGIYNSNTITTLNNAQGGNGASLSQTALTFDGNLPTNYNIILVSSTHYGQLAVTSPNYTDGTSGKMSFGIYTGTVSSSFYSAVLSGISSSYISNTRTGTYGGYTWTLSETTSGSGIWDLLFSGYSNIPSGPTVIDTQSSLHTLAPKLRTGFTQQIMATNFANMNTYDCNLFDAKGLCISAGGQQTYVDQPSSNFTSAVVTAGYRVSPTIRIGGFLNQNVNNSTGASVDISNGTPLMGLFAVWNQNEDHLGYQVKIANAYQDQDVRTIRDIVGTSEAGRGNTEINTQSYVGELSYAFRANEDKTLVRPYAAVRYTRVKQDGYTEQTTSTVTAPLTYSALSDRSTTALVGVKLNHKLAEKVHLTGSLGIEQDLYHHVDDLKATGVSGLTSENFNDNIKRTRPVASIGATYTPAKNQRIAGTVFYQQLPFQSTGATTAYVNYTIGF